MFIFLPFTTFYYETNEEISVKVRIKGASFRCVSYGLAVIIIMVVTYFILKGEDSQPFPIYVISFFMILGWFLLFFTLGVGLIAVPFDLIYEYIKRPQPMKSAEFEVQKKMLLDNLLFLRLRCNETFELKTKVDSQKGFIGWWNSSRLTRRVASIHSKTLLLEDEYVKLVKISKYSKYVEPMSYYFKMALGIVLTIIN